MCVLIKSTHLIFCMFKHFLNFSFYFIVRFILCFCLFSFMARIPPCQRFPPYRATQSPRAAAQPAPVPLSGLHFLTALARSPPRRGRTGVWGAGLGPKPRPSQRRGFSAALPLRAVHASFFFISILSSVGVSLQAPWL